MGRAQGREQPVAVREQPVPLGGLARHPEPRWGLPVHHWASRAYSAPALPPGRLLGPPPCPAPGDAPIYPWMVAHTSCAHSTARTATVTAAAARAPSAAPALPWECGAGGSQGWERSGCAASTGAPALPWESGVGGPPGWVRSGCAVPSILRGAAGWELPGCVAPSTRGGAAGRPGTTPRTGRGRGNPGSSLQTMRRLSEPSAPHPAKRKASPAQRGGTEPGGHTGGGGGA